MRARWLVLALALTGCGVQNPEARFVLDAPGPRPLAVLPSPGALSLGAAVAHLEGGVTTADTSPLAAPIAHAGGGSGSPMSAPSAPVRRVPYLLDRIAADPMQQISGVAIDPDSGLVFLGDPLRHQIRAIAPDGRSWIVAGSATGENGFDGERLPATANRLDGPAGLAFDVPSGALLVADANNRRVRYFQPGGLMYTLAGGGSDPADSVPVARDAAIGQPFGLAGDLQGNIWFGERDTGKVRRITPTGALETPARLPGGRAGAIAVQAATGLAWVSDDHAVYALTPGLQARPIYTTAGRITAIAHDQRDALIIATTSETAPGTRDTRIWRLPLAPGGVIEWIAGSGSSGAAAADYRLPVPTVPDATTQLLAGAGFCSLAIDWSHDRIYAASSYAGADPAGFSGEAFRLTPTPWR